jgi:hypothetical protein
VKILLANQEPSTHGTLSPTFEKAGYALGTSPTVSPIPTWSIDNRSDSDGSDPKHYLVRSEASQLRVFVDATDRLYFDLPVSFAAELIATKPSQALIGAFVDAGYGLAASATIAAGQNWSIQASADAVSSRAFQSRAFRYRHFTVIATGATLTVCGSTMVWLRDWPQYPDGLAFAATNGLEEAMNPTSLGPSGVPMAWLAAKRQSRTQFFTASA